MKSESLFRSNGETDGGWARERRLCAARGLGTGAPTAAPLVARAVRRGGAPRGTVGRLVRCPVHAGHATRGCGMRGCGDRPSRGHPPPPPQDLASLGVRRGVRPHYRTDQCRPEAMPSTVRLCQTRCVCVWGGGGVPQGSAAVLPPGCPSLDRPTPPQAPQILVPTGLRCLGLPGGENPTFTTSIVSKDEDAVQRRGGRLSFIRMQTP